MAVENYYTRFSTTVATGGYTAGSGVLNVASTTGTAANFRVVITDQTTGAFKCLIKVIGVNTSTQFATTTDPGGTDAPCNAGDIVYANVTADAMDQIRFDQSQLGTSASLPSTPGQKTGNRYKTTDGPYEYIYTGSVWQAYLRGSQVTPPGPVSGWTGVNTGSNWTATDVGGSINIQIARNASLNWRLITKAQPSTPYKRVFYLSAIAPWQNSSTAGVYFYDGTKLMGLEVLFQAGPNMTLRVEEANSVTADQGTAMGVAGIGLLITHGVWFRLQNSGTTLSFDWSLDGVVWNTLFSQAVGTFITPTKYGVGGVAVTGTSTDLTNISFLSDAAG